MWLMITMAYIPQFPGMVDITWEQAIAKVRDANIDGGYPANGSEDQSVWSDSTTTNHPRYYYHFTRGENHDSIMTNGLDADLSLGGKYKRIYMSVDRFGDRQEYRIDTEGISLRPDPELPDKWAIAMQDIPPSRIEFLG